MLQQLLVVLCVDWLSIIYIQFFSIYFNIGIAFIMQLNNMYTFITTEYKLGVTYDLSLLLKFTLLVNYLITVTPDQRRFLSLHQPELIHVDKLKSLLWMFRIPLNTHKCVALKKNSQNFYLWLSELNGYLLCTSTSDPTESQLPTLWPATLSQYKVKL